MLMIIGWKSNDAYYVEVDTFQNIAMNNSSA